MHEHFREQNSEMVILIRFHNIVEFPQYNRASVHSFDHIVHLDLSD